MGMEKMVNDLYKFLKSDVTDKKLFEATDEAYKDVQSLNEGKLPKDLSIVEAPKDYIKLLMEKGVEGDVKPAEITEEVPVTKVEKVADKETPDVDKKSDASAAVKVAEKKPKVKNEGKLPADLSQVQKPTDEIYQLAENEVEAPVTVTPDEATANSIVNKIGTGKARAEKNQKGQFTVYTKEAKKDVKVTGVKVEGSKKVEDVIKKQQESKIKEETTTEMPAVTIAKVPDVSTDGTKAVDTAPVANANPDNKDKAGIAGEVNADSGIQKVANANPDNKDGAVIKEETTTEPTTGEVKAVEVPMVDADKQTDVPMTPVVNANPDNKDGKDIKGEVNVSADADKLANASPDNKDTAAIVKEDVTVDVKAADQTVSVTADEQGGTSVSMSSAAPVDVAPVEEVPSDIAPVEAEPIEELPAEEFPAEEEMEEEELEVAEKLFLVDYLGSKKSLTEKEQKFIKEAKAIQLPASAWQRVSKKIAEFKAKK